MSGGRQRATSVEETVELVSTSIARQKCKARKERDKGLKKEGKGGQTGKQGCNSSQRRGRARVNNNRD